MVENEKPPYNKTGVKVGHKTIITLHTPFESVHTDSRLIESKK